jgi:hypothetical protein
LTVGVDCPYHICRFHCCHCVAVINIFPPLTEIGDNMTANFVRWGEKRIAQIPTDPTMAQKSQADKDTEIGKIKDRLRKFKEKMQFLEGCKTLTAEARHAKKLLPMEVSM